MNAKNIESKFAGIGARLKVREIASRWQMGNRKWIDPVNYTVDIRRDRAGEFFELRMPTHLSETVEATVTITLPFWHRVVMNTETQRHDVESVASAGASPAASTISACKH